MLKPNYKMILLNLLDVCYVFIWSCCGIRYAVTKVVCMIVHNYEIIQWLQCDNKLNLKFLNLTHVHKAIPTIAILNHKHTDANPCFSMHRWFEFTHFSLLQLSMNIYQHLVLCLIIINMIDFKFKFMQKPLTCHCLFLFSVCIIFF